jgi:hypothetical protein
MARPAEAKRGEMTRAIKTELSRIARKEKAIDSGPIPSKFDQPCERPGLHSVQGIARVTHGKKFALQDHRTLEGKWASPAASKDDSTKKKASAKILRKHLAAAESSTFTHDHITVMIRRCR